MSISQEILALIRRVKCPHFDEFESRKRIRQFFLPRRICIFAIGLFVLLYFLIFSKSSTTSIAELCLDDRLRHWKLRENDFSISLLGQTLHFTANGCVLFFSFCSLISHAYIFLIKTIDLMIKFDSITSFSK